MKNLIIWNTMVDVNGIPSKTLGPYALASWLEHHGYTVKVIDYCHILTTKQLVKLTEKHIGKDTVGIGVSSTFWSIDDHRFQTHPQEPEWVLAARDSLERRYPSVKWLIGGANSTEFLSDLEWIKFNGHAEDSLLKWMDELNNDKSIRPAFDIATPCNPFKISDCITKDEVLPIEFTRGCQFKCKFCRYPLIGKKKGTYLRNFNNIENELLRNYDMFGTTRYSMMDDTFNESNEKIRALADIAQRLPFELEWVASMRLDLIGTNRWSIDMLKDSGMRSCFFGIESFNQVASKAVGKGWNGVHGKNMLLELKSKWGNRINFHLSLITGLPGETEKDIMETNQWCIDHGMYNWKWIGLHINRKESFLYKSIFDTEYYNYGYSFPNPMRSYEWKNDNFTSGSANKLAAVLNEHNRQYMKPSTFLLAKVASLGYSFDDIMSRYQYQMDWESLVEESNAFVQSYYMKQMYHTN